MKALGQDPTEAELQVAFTYVTDNTLNYPNYLGYYN